jgi:transcriptional regulator with XRE-family HTH domain
MTRPTHEQFKKKALSDPKVKEAFDALDEEFELIAELIKTRKMRKKSQKEVADAMGTSASAVSRLEAGTTASQGHSPSLATLRRYAHALGCKLYIKLIPEERL